MGASRIIACRCRLGLHRLCHWTYNDEEMEMDDISTVAVAALSTSIPRPRRSRR